MDEPVESGKPTKPWLRNNLVTLGSAAVFTVYSAGYFRTREAAQRFAGESVQRKSAVAVSPQTTVRTVAPSTNAPRKSEAVPAVIHPSSSAKAEAPAGKTDSVPTAPVSAPVPEPAPVAIAPAAPVTPPAPAPVVDSAPATPEKKSDGKLKDGVFYGWGTSRHGDIQASLEIENGKIIGAYISQCRTQYSCSWVSMLPGQVVQRQSADVDYVSGATQSSNAFYYGVLEALKKAKGF
jgi:uncharacterized protein with FMN-binding domain